MKSKTEYKPSDEKISKYIRKSVNGADSELLTVKSVYDNVCSKFPTSLDSRKFVIKRAIELCIARKLLHQDESDDEPLSQKAKKLPSLTLHNEVSKFVEKLLDDSDPDTITVRSIFGLVQEKYKLFEDYDFVREIVKSHLKLKRSPVEKEAHSTDNQEDEETYMPPVEVKLSPNHCAAKAKVENLKLRRVGSKKSKILNFSDNNGYLYSKITTRNSTMYLRCKNYVMHSCKASVIVRNNCLSEAILKKKHNHLSEEKLVDRAKFNKKLQEICHDWPFLTARVCYQRAKIALKGKIDRDNIPSLQSFESIIYRAQKIDVPPLPKTIAELQRLICADKYGTRYTHDEAGNLLFRGVWRSSTGDNVAFVSERTLQQVRKLQHLELLMDGTFKVLPCHLKFRQLYIVNVIIKKRSYPLAFILMEKKDTISYELVFEKLKELISSSFLTVQCMTDYEASTRKAFKKVFPEGKIYGCYFHYVQAITKAFRRYGLNKTDHRFDGTMQKISALALLPNDFILAGFKSIEKDIKKSKTFTRFKEYWMKQWSKANISVYGLINRTNNFAESLNKSINLLNASRHPHVWRLIHNLIYIEMDKSDELKRIVAGEIITFKRNKAMKKLDSKIEDATKEFEETQDVEAFLNSVTVNEKIQNFFKERIYLEGIDDEKYSTLDYEDEDEFIPNDFRESSCFRKQFPRSCVK